MKIAVCITGWRRPDYFKQVIDGVLSNTNYKQFEYIVSIDHGGKFEEHEQILHDAKLGCELIKHKSRQGCAGNVGYTFIRAFDHVKADAVIMLEDDTVPGPDMFDYMIKMLEQYKDDLNVWNISAYRRRGVVDKQLDTNHPQHAGRGDLSKVFKRDHFTSWAWATWKRTRDEMGDEWFGIHWNHKEGKTGTSCPRGDQFLEYVKICNTGSWAWPMNMYWRRDRVEVAPDVSRCQNVGATQGMFVPSAGWHHENHHVEYWTGDGKYSLTDNITFYEHNNI